MSEQEIRAFMGAWGCRYNPTQCGWEKDGFGVLSLLDEAESPDPLRVARHALMTIRIFREDPDDE